MVENPTSHYAQLERMYLAAPINQFYLPQINVSKAACEIILQVKTDFHHAAEAVHGSVYFKQLDDAAFFSANSLVADVFVLTGSFEVKFLRPVFSGTLIARGEVVREMDHKLEAKAILVDQAGKLIATGNGIFVKSKILLESIDSYKI